MPAQDYPEGMSSRTVDWTPRPSTPAGAASAEGLRARKKRLMRQQLTDTATEMFLERGFDAVRVSEIAEACGVSEKTVFNYFPTKESLLLDRWDATMAALRTGLADTRISPVEATLKILGDELDAMSSWLAAQEDLGAAIARVQRFGTLIQTTPALRAHQRDVMDQLIAMVADLLAERARVSADDPEPQIVATALVGLWQVHLRALRKHLAPTRSPDQVREAVDAEVHRAARLIDAGLQTFGAAEPPATVTAPRTGE
jgi:AcrR family transcriptional regulator